MARAQKGAMTKMAAIRQAVSELGNEAPLVDILKYVKRTFNLDIPRTVAYTYKSAAIKQAGGKRKGRKPGRKPAGVVANGKRAVGVTLEDIQAVKVLADRMGAEKVAQLAAVLQ